MRRNWLEWVVLIVSGIVLAGIVGFLVADGLAGSGAPPKPVITLHRDAAYESDGSWLLPATVRNDGETAAEAVVVRASARVDSEVEESELTIDYLPARSSVDVTFGLSGSPDGEVTVSTVGFRLP